MELLLSARAVVVRSVHDQIQRYESQRVLRPALLGLVSLLISKSKRPVSLRQHTTGDEVRSGLTAIGSAIRHLVAMLNQQIDT